MPVIRKAKQSDALSLAGLAERTFRDTFEAANTTEDMLLHCESHYSEVIQLREVLDPAIEPLVCDHGGNLIGFAQLRRGQPPGCIKAERPVEIQRLYVSKEWHGKGVAQDLMAASIVMAEEANADHVWLGVWERNPRAIAVYRKLGFSEVGDHVFVRGTDPQRDIIRTRELRADEHPSSQYTIFERKHS